MGSMQMPRFKLRSSGTLDNAFHGTKPVSVKAENSTRGPRAASSLIALPCSYRKVFYVLAPTSRNTVINAVHVSNGGHHCQQCLHLCSTLPPWVHISSCCSQRASNIQKKQMTGACFTQVFSHWQKLHAAGCQGLASPFPLTGWS